jgi:hypothetical protein
VDRVRPTPRDQTVDGKLDQKVSEMKWIEDASIIHDDGRIRGHDFA